jgi:hypothetical protein
MSDPLDLFEGLNTPPVIEPPKKTTSYRRVYVNFVTEADVAKYAQLINRRITAKTKELWFPPHEGSAVKNKELFEYSESAFYEAPVSKKSRHADVELGEDLFDCEYDPGFYELHWQDMPLFTQEDAGAVRKISHFFKSDAEVQEFARLIDQNITDKTPSIWWPYRAKNDSTDIYWASTL